MKKAIMMKTLVIVIIALFTMAILFPGFGKLYAFIKSSSVDKVCQISVQKHSLILDKTFDTKATSIDCPRKNVVFADSHVKIDGKRQLVKENMNDRPGYKYKKLNDYIVNQVLADQLAKCWENMGEGEQTVFKSELTGGVKLVCLVCNQISFDLSQEKTFTGLKEYLEGYGPKKSDITYMKYLTRTEELYWMPYGFVLPWSDIYFKHFTDQEGKSFKIEQAQEFSSEKQYVILFYGFKPEWLAEALSGYEDAYYVKLVEPSQVSQICSYIYN